MKRCICLAVALGVSVVASIRSEANPQSETILLGFIDDAREEMVNWKPGVAVERLIRPAFEKGSSGWRVITANSLPAKPSWTIAFDGKNLGSVTSETSHEGAQDDIGDVRALTLVQRIVTPESVPNVGQATQTFAGLMAIGPGKTRRPLVVVSEPYFRDPDGWRRMKSIPDDVAAKVRSTFRRDFPQVQKCKDEEVIERNWKFPDASLLLTTAYGSDKHAFLIQTRLNAGNCGYVDDPKDPLSEPWYFVSEAGTRRLGGLMTLLDAGDYDNDGRSEVIFFLTQPEDTDGFILFDADLCEQARLTWSYH